MPVLTPVVSHAIAAVVGGATSLATAWAVKKFVAYRKAAAVAPAAAEPAAA